MIRKDVNSFSTKENWYALIIAILGNCIPEVAFKKLESNHPDRVKMQYTKADLEDIYKIKKSGVTYTELADIYCTTPYSLYHILNRAKKKGVISERRENEIECQSKI
ncbi:hypothetical protein [Thermoanaerobacterium sp. DL9XJH110]|uniref:hypothetical protein n=1 Tax=Thermoanaerobacterium sp. DL9XJH110 TaxID=3386643 RepID=UPI003BB5B61A